MFAGLRKRLLGTKDAIREAGGVTAKDRAGAFLMGEVVMDEAKLEEVFSSLELALLESDVALEAAEKITGDLKAALLGRRLKRGRVDDVALEALRESLRSVLSPGADIPDLVKGKDEKPYVMVFVGVNGTGKTTTIAKVAHLLQGQGLSCVIAASDTFRAGAVEQLEKHASRLGVKLIKHGKGADPAAVAYDAVEHAKAKGKDAVLIDTAGRMETNVNLMDEMRKIVRVVKPDLVLFVGDSLAGNAVVDQAERFNEAVALDGAILTKADADAKGGSAISIASAIHKPVFYLGVGQEYGDLRKFEIEWFLDELLGR